MLRSVLALAGAAGFGLALAGLAPVPDPADPAPTPTALAPTAPAAKRACADAARPSVRWVEAGAEACEPGTPLGVQLLQPEGLTAGRAELVFEIRPDGEVHDLAWEWVVPQEVIWLEGERVAVASEASLEAGAARVAAAAELAAAEGHEHDDAELGDELREVHAGSVRVDLPHDGMGRGVTLRVTGFVEGSNELGETWLEPVVEERTAMFGAPTTNAVAVTTRDTESSEPITVLAVPTRHRAGR